MCLEHAHRSISEEFLEFIHLHIPQKGTEKNKKKEDRPFVLNMKPFFILHPLSLFTHYFFYSAYIRLCMS
jgi:hypothetical protein